MLKYLECLRLGHKLPSAVFIITVDIFVDDKVSLLGQ